MTKKHLTDDFYVHEFACKCGRKECDATPMEPAFMQLLQALRTEWGKPLVPSSGQRCRYHNDRIKGSAKNSQHLYGKAADFNFSNRDTLEAFVSLAEKHFMGIGFGHGLVHVDNRKKRARWTY